MKLEYIVTKTTKYQSIKQVLKEEFFISDRLIIKLKKSKQIYLNGKAIHINELIKCDDIITIDLDFQETSDNIVSSQMDLDIIYEDDALLIVNKPPFVPVHPSMDHYDDSLSNGIKYYFNSIGLNRKIRPVNRLDKNTSGIVIFAKNEYTQENLIRQMKSSEFKKEYITIVDGVLEKKEQIIEAPIARKENSIIERCVSPNGDSAITIIELLETFNNYSLIKCTLKTGRTHQIRVHTSYIGHTILGDDLYGKKSDLINRQALHAHKVSFVHPITKAIIKLKAPIPKDMEELI